MRKNYKLTIRYDGGRYLGWQHQPGKDMEHTIQGKLELVLSRMLEEEKADASVEVIGAGRTDAGVHALAMTASVFLDTEKTEQEIFTYLNHYLPDDIAVDEVKTAADRFHARYNAAGKTYCYTCWCGRTKPVFDRKYVMVLEEMPDLDRMRKAAEFMEGEHDFASFCTLPGKNKSTVRIVDKIAIEQDGRYIRMTFHGTGFLRNMVRILTGTLLDVGYGKKTPEQVREIMEAKDRKLAGPTADPQGLCLIKVDY